MRIQARFFVYLFAILFAWVNAQVAESVSVVQLDRAYQCSQAGVKCTGDFGNIWVRQPWDTRSQ